MKFLSALFLICFCAGSHTIACRGKDPSFYLKQYGLDTISPLIVVVVNPNECEAYKIGLDKIGDKIVESKIENHAVYLFTGLRDKEVEYYMKKILNISAGIRAINDDNFFASISSGSSLMTILNRDGSSKTYDIFNAAKNLEINKKQVSYGLGVIDSVALDEQVPLSVMADNFVVDDSTILSVDPRYNSIVLYDLRNGKTKSALDIEYDYLKLYDEHIGKQDTAKKNFAENNRKFIKQLGQSEFKILNSFVKNSQIYIFCQIMYGYRYQKDTAFFGFTFLLHADKDFKTQQFLFIPSFSDSIFISPNVFSFLNDSTVIFSTYKKKSLKNREQIYLASFKISQEQNEVLFDKYMDAKIPAFITENHLDYIKNKFFYYNKRPYCYFGAFIPFTYSVDGKDVITYPDDSYKKVDVSQIPPFNIQEVHQSVSDDLCFITYENDLWFFSVLDVKNTSGKNIKYKTDIPFIRGNAKYMFFGNDLYVLKNNPKNTMLYRMKYVSIK